METLNVANMETIKGYSGKRKGTKHRVHKNDNMIYPLWWSNMIFHKSWGLYIKTFSNKQLKTQVSLCHFLLPFLPKEIGPYILQIGLHCKLAYIMLFSVDDDWNSFFEYINNHNA